MNSNNTNVNGSSIGSVEDLALGLNIACNRDFNCSDTVYDLLVCIETICMEDSVVSTTTEIADTTETTSSNTITTSTGTSTTSTSTTTQTSDVDITDCDTSMYCACIGGTFELTISSNDACDAYDQFVKTCQEVFSSSATVKFNPSSCTSETATSLEVGVVWKFASVSAYESNSAVWNELSKSYLFQDIKVFAETKEVDVSFSWSNDGFATYSEDDTMCDWSEDFIDVDEELDSSAANLDNSVAVLLAMAAALYVCFL
jgi:hypothetical protein